MLWLNIVKAIPKWTGIYFLKDKDLGITLSFMTGVLYSSIVFSTTYPDAIKNSIKNYGWFGYAKRFSLLLGLLAYWLIYYYPSYTSTRITQYILFINVIEAGILAIQNKEYFIGVLLLAISQFTPEFTISDISLTVIANKGSILQLENYGIGMSVDSYFKYHYSLLASLYLFGNYFSVNKIGIWAAATCLAPLVIDSMEINNHGSNFLIRTMMLILGTIIDTTIDPNFMEKTYFKTNLFETNYLLRNIVQATTFVILYNLPMMLR